MVDNNKKNGEIIFTHIRRRVRHQSVKTSTSEVVELRLESYYNIRSSHDDIEMFEQCQYLKYRHGRFLESSPDIPADFPELVHSVD